MSIHAPIATGIPRGVTLADLESDNTVDCASCGAALNPDEAVGITIGDEMFCDNLCLSDWVADNRDDIIERIQE